MEQQPQTSSRRPTRVLGGLLFGLAMVMAIAVLWPIVAGRTGSDPQATPAADEALTAEAADPPEAGEPATRPAAALSDEAWSDRVPGAIDRQPPTERAAADLVALFELDVPARDYFRTAEELGGLDLGERRIVAPTRVPGERLSFNTADGPREAELRLVTDAAYYWVETGIAVDMAALEADVRRMEAELLPLIHDVFGLEWLPGVDGDDRFAVLHTLGSPEVFELGYFNDENEYPRVLFAESNETEMVFINMSRLAAGTPPYLSTLIHELQHLVQWNMDGNEAVWMNEGLSQLAETMTGLGPVATAAHQQRPDIRLDRWSRDPAVTGAHYATSYLFLHYLWEQVGDDAIRELSRHPADGLAAARAVLVGHAPGRTLESFAADWAVANYLDDPRAGAAYHYERLELEPAFLRSRIRRLPDTFSGSLDQYAVDYIDLDFSGPTVVRFAGDTRATLFDPPPGDATTAWYAPPADSSRMQLTAALDLTGFREATLSFDAWYDLETGWDFAYLVASIDGGRTWEPLRPRNSADASFGPAFNGRSAEAPGQQGGWVSETISLASYAGRQVLVRFDVVSDFEGLGRGIALANLTVPELAAAGVPPVWQPAGFVEVGPELPQQWAVRLIVEGEEPVVVPLALDARNRAEAAIELGPEGGALVVMPLTPFVDAQADYWLEVESQ